MRGVLVVGAGQAGVLLAEALRRNGYTDPVTLVGDEAELPYERPPLSKAYLAADPADIRLRPRGFYADQGIELVTGRRVVALRRSEHAVGLDDGTRLGYGHAVLATGARCRALPVPGATLDGVVALRTRADADQLRARLRPGTAVVLVGAGFIGLELAAAARAAGCHTTVLDVADRVMGRAVSTVVGTHVADRHRESGTVLHLRTGVRAVRGHAGRVTGVDTTDGATLPADLVVVGIGVVANTDLAEVAGLDTGGGIVVDEYLRTSDPDISAIGDCAAFPFGRTGGRVRLESVQNAADQARCVAARLVGRPRPYRDLPWFWSHQGQLKLQIAGLRVPDSDVVVRGEPASGRFSALTYAGPRLVCVESVNRPADHLAARKLLSADVSPPRELAADPTVDLRQLAAA